MVTNYLETKIQEVLVFEALGALDERHPRDYHPPYKVIELIKDGNINFGSIYDILGRLETRGLVTVTDGLVKLTNRIEN